MVVWLIWKSCRSLSFTVRRMASLSDMGISAIAIWQLSACERERSFLARTANVRRESGIGRMREKRAGDGAEHGDCEGEEDRDAAAERFWVRMNFVTPGLVNKTEPRRDPDQQGCEHPRYDKADRAQAQDRKDHPTKR